MPELISKLTGKVGEVSASFPILFAAVAVLVLAVLTFGAIVTKNTEKRTAYLIAMAVVLALCVAFAGIAGIVSWATS